MSLLLGLFPAILMALAVVREKELGSITNLYVTPVTRLEFLLGKQLPYIGVALANFTLMFLMAVFIFQVPLKGSFPPLLLGVLLYVTAMTAYGMLISAFTSTQIAALFGTAILTVLPATQFAGMMTPVSSLGGAAQVIGRAFPMTYFVPSASGPSPRDWAFSTSARTSRVGGLPPILILLNLLLLRKQEANKDAQGREHILARRQGAAQLLCTITCLLGLVVYSFSLAVIMQARSNSQELNNGSLAIVDEDHSELSRRIAHAFLPPLFQPPQTDRRGGISFP
jgi:hypothetical protein